MGIDKLIHFAYVRESVHRSHWCADDTHSTACVCARARSIEDAEGVKMQLMCAYRPHNWRKYVRCAVEAIGL